MKRKAQVPEWIIIFATLAICLAAIYNIATFPGKTASAISIDNASNVYTDEKKFMVYFDEAADLSSIQAFSETAKSPSGSKCGKYGEIIIWADGCPNNTEITTAFVKNLNNSLISYGFQVYQIDISDKIDISLNEKSSEIIEANNLLSYRVNYSHIPEVSIEKPDLDFEKIYASVMDKKTECDLEFKDGRENKEASIGVCLGKLNLDGWNTFIASSGGYYLFNFNSKKFYLYDNSFKPLVLAFALKKQ